jgi:hypothetical protein
MQLLDYPNTNDKSNLTKILNQGLSYRSVQGRNTCSVGHRAQPPPGCRAPALVALAMWVPVAAQGTEKPLPVVGVDLRALGH